MITQNQQNQTVERSVIHTFTADETTQLRKDIADRTLLLSEKEKIKKSVSATVAIELTTEITDNDRQQFLPIEEEKKGKGKR